MSDFSGVDFDLLADYLGGALAGTPDQERVATRIAGDPDWRAAHDALAGATAAVSVTLHELTPEPMPDELAARLDAALREPAGAAVPIRMPADRRADGAAPRRSRWRPRWVAPVAVAAGVIACAGFGLTQFSADQSDKAGSSTAEHAVPGVAMDGSMVQQVPAADQILSTGTDYSRETLDQWPSRTFGKPAVPGSETPGTPGPNAPAAEPPNTAGRQRAATTVLLACLGAIARENAGGPIAVQSVDYARFEGTPAVVVRFTAANGGWSWASRADCGTPGTGAATLARMPVR